MAAPTKQEIAEGIARLNGTVRKYRNQHTSCSLGHLHPSKKEANRCQELRLRVMAGEIENLEYWPQYVFEHNGVLIGKYTADWRYQEDGKEVVEDCKSAGTKTTATNLRMKLMKAFFGIEVREI